MIHGLVLVALVAGQTTTATRSPIGVAVSSKRAASEEFARGVAARLQQSLASTLATSVLTDDETTRVSAKDPKSCQAASACLVTVAQALGKRAVVVGVDVGRVRSTLAVYVEAFAADTGESLATADFSVPTEKWEAAVDGPFQDFAKALAPKLQVAVAVARVEATKPVEPTETKDTSWVKEQAEGAPAPIGKWVTLGVAGVSAAVSLVFCVIGLANYDLYQRSLSKGEVDGLTYSTMTRAKLEQTASTVNTSFNVAIISGITSAAFAGLTAVLFATAPVEKPKETTALLW